MQNEIGGNGEGRTRKLCKPYFILFSQWKYTTVIVVQFPVYFCHGCIQFLFLYLYVFSELWFISWCYSSIYGTFRFVGNCLCLGKYVIFLSRGMSQEEGHSFSKLGLRQLLLCPCLQSHTSTCGWLCGDLLVKTHGGFIWNVSEEK